MIDHYRLGYDVTSIELIIGGVELRLVVIGNVLTSGLSSTEYLKRCAYRLEMAQVGQRQGPERRVVEEL